MYFTREVIAKYVLEFPKDPLLSLLATHPSPVMESINSEFTTITQALERYFEVVPEVYRNAANNILSKLKPEFYNLQIDVKKVVDTLVILDPNEKSYINANLSNAEEILSNLQKKISRLNSELLKKYNYIETIPLREIVYIHAREIDHISSFMRSNKDYLQELALYLMGVMYYFSSNYMQGFPARFIMKITPSRLKEFFEYAYNWYEDNSEVDLFIDNYIESDFSVKYIELYSEIEKLNDRYYNTYIIGKIETDSGSFYWIPLIIYKVKPQEIISLDYREI